MALNFGGYEMRAFIELEEMLKERALENKKARDGENYSEIPDFKAGDTLNVALRVVEGEKERIQNFKGIVIKRRGSGINQTFTIRKISNGIGVERILPLYSPMIQSIQVLKRGRTRRAKLYFLRGISEKKIRQTLS